MPDYIYQMLGKHEAEIVALKEDFQEIKMDVKSILEVLSEAKGGWRTLAWVAGSASAFTFGMLKLITFVGWLPK